MSTKYNHGKDIAFNVGDKVCHPEYYNEIIEFIEAKIKCLEQLKKMSTKFSAQITSLWKDQ